MVRARVAIEKAHVQQETAIGILPGGTVNAFYKYLVEQGASVKIEEFVDTPNDTLNLYRPALVDDNVFAIAAGFGGWEVNYAMLHEDPRIRHLPRDKQPQLVGAASIVRLLKRSLTTQRPVLNSVFAIPKAGTIRAANSNEMEGGLLAQVKIPGERQIEAVIRGTAILAFCHFTGAPLSRYVDTTYSESISIFENEVVRDGRSVDGTFIKTHPQSYTVKRSSKQIPVVALTT